MKKIEILNLYKHNIVHKNTKNYQIKSFIISLVVCIVTMFCFTYLNLYNDNVQLSISAFNPISELYRDVEVASFVGSDNVNFIVPIKTEKYTINSNNIIFEVSSSIMVYSPANGVVEEIGIDEYKYIKIKHSENLYSVISNVDIVGVKVGDVVKQGKEIATARPNKNVVFCILDNGNMIEGLYLNKSFVKWNSN